MSRRKGHHDEELPFVALMDTMTNVVGVLMIVFVVVALSLANAMQKILSELPNVTPEEHQEMKKKLHTALLKHMATNLLHAKHRKKFLNNTP
jgi:biopolymer transport protein ExbD